MDNWYDEALLGNYLPFCRAGRLSYYKTAELQTFTGFTYRREHLTCFLRVPNDFSVLPENIKAICMDKATNNTSFYRVLLNHLDYGHIHEIRCFAHKLNLACKSALETNDEKIKALRDLVIKIKGSALRREKFARHCETCVISTLMIIWMLKRDGKGHTIWNNPYLCYPSTKNSLNIICSQHIALNLR